MSPAPTTVSVAPSLLYTTHFRSLTLMMMPVSSSRVELQKKDEAALADHSSSKGDMTEEEYGRKIPGLAAASSGVHVGLLLAW